MSELARGSQVRVCSVPARFRRAGIEFTRDTQVLDVAALTPEQLAVIAAEPLLVVEVVAAPVRVGDDAPPAKKGRK